MARSITAMIQMMGAVKGFLKDQDMSMEELMTFAHVADRQEIPMQDLQNAVGVSGSSISRHVLRLGNGRPREPGFGLVEAYEDPEYRKRKLVKLTARGSALVSELDKAAARFLKSAA